MGSVAGSSAAWLLFPMVFIGVTLGLGLLAERVMALRLPSALVAPFGMCVAVVLTYSAYQLGVGATVVAPLLGLIAVLGLVLSRRELRERMRPGAAALAALAVYGLYLAPVVLAGGWTWTGYNFVNDTAVQLLLADHLMQSGAAIPAGPPEAPADSTTSEHLRNYLGTSYPIGSHALLATLGSLVPAPLAAIYQPFIALLVASSAAALVALARRSGLSALAAGLAGFGAVAANLTYHYALQGNVKEIAAFAALATTVALGREALTDDRPVRAVASVAIGMAALLSIYSTAGVPYIGCLAVLLFAGVFVHPDSQLRKRLVPALATGAGVLLVAALAALTEVINFGRTATAVLGSTEADPNAELAHLLRPLELVQTAGVWLSADYRIAVLPGRELLTWAGIVLVFALMVLGVAWLARRRESGPLLLLGSVAITLAVVGPRVSPYAEGKLLAIASPAVVLVAGFGVALLAQASRVAASALGAVALGAVLLSNAYAYHSIQLAPVDRMLDMKQLAERYEDEDGLILINEFEEFAKYFMRDARINVATEAITPHQVELREPQTFVARYFDLDQQELGYVKSFPLIVRRRSPDASRPPENFRLEHRSRYYEAWRRHDDLRVLEHLPAGSLYRAAGVPDCGELLAMAGRARPGDRLLARRARDVVQLDIAVAKRSPSWAPHPFIPGAITTTTPGSAQAELFFEGGRYRTWVQGSFGRDIRVSLGGRAIGSVRGVDTPGQWTQAGVVDIPRGSHEATLTRGGGGLAPGDGFVGALGPLAFERLGAPEPLRVQPERARSLCGRELDWVERVRSS